MVITFPRSAPDRVTGKQRLRTWHTGHGQQAHTQSRNCVQAGLYL